MSSVAENLAEVLEEMVCALVDEESAVRVEVHVEKFHTNYMVSVAAKDFGKLLGRKGVTIDAVRTLTNAMGRKLKLPEPRVYVNDPNPDKRKKNRT